MRLQPLLLLTLCAATAHAQWSDVRMIGKGGESTVASDGKGNVFVTAHIPCALYASRDWGDTFQLAKSFPDGLGDMFVLPHGEGLLNVTYCPPKIDQIRSWYSNDGGRTMLEGIGPQGPLDREWVVAHPDGTLYMDYSNGYIGGPKSKGVFLASSKDNGKTFTEMGRFDNEPEGSYGIDPFLTMSSKGRLYAMWLVSKDYDTIASYDFAYSDSGLDFKGHKTLVTYDKTVKGTPVDIQERWMLGAVIGVGEKNVVMVYPGYEMVNVDGAEHLAFIMHWRYSIDGGDTFSEPKSVLGDSELKNAVRENLKNRKSDDAYPYYIQILPWLCADADGRVHMAFTDNRNGQTILGDKPVNRWQVRMASCDNFGKGFGRSEVVSKEYRSRRTPMDFLSCTADSKYLYVTWTANEGSTGDWPKAGVALFTGDLYCARKPLK